MLRNIFLIFILSLFLLSCTNNEVFNSSTNLKDSLWNYQDTLEYNFNVTDINKTYNVYIQLKNTENYNYSNLFIFSKIDGPKNESIIDTIDCIICDQKGKWYGEKKSTLWYNKLLFRKRIRFPEAGNYKFSFVQAMRDDNLKEITNFGLTIEYADKN